MPYKRSSRRSGGARRSTSKAVKAYVKQAIRRSMETKANTASQTGVTITSAGSITGLLVAAQGSSSAQRDGDVVAPSGGVINVGIQNGTAGGGSQFLRFMVVQAKPGEPAPGIADFPDWVSPVTLEQRTKYRVLYDKTMAVNPLDSAGAAGHLRTLEIRFRTKQRARWAPATTGGVAPDDGGAITFYKTTDVGAAGPILVWKSECFYKDV